VTVSAAGLHAIVLDIEGTTTPVAFVYDVLFPFARAHAADFLDRHWTSPSCRAAVDALAKERAADAGAPGSADFKASSVVAYVHWLMDRDRKSPGLKALQGLIWQDGYRSGELRGEVFEDVPRALERWRAKRIAVHIYSSGSVLAQQLLFQSTAAGDLTRLLGGYFDTGIGAKTSSDSYRAILQQLGVSSPAALFVSDVSAELDAALAAGFRTALCVRDAAAAPAATGGGKHPVVRSFDEIES
jgi:enolase-phosphatase E1